MSCPVLRCHHRSGSVTLRAAMANSPRNSTVRNTRSVRSGPLIADHHSGGPGYSVQSRSTVALERHPIRAADLADIAAASCALLYRGYVVAEPALFSRYAGRHQAGISGFHYFLHGGHHLAPGTWTSALRPKGPI